MTTKGTQQRGVRVSDERWRRFNQMIVEREEPNTTASDVIRRLIDLYVSGGALPTSPVVHERAEGWAALNMAPSSVAPRSVSL